nr:hypothetical protein [Tanacetum cinerariifolium]
MSLLQEALDACAALTRRVDHLEYDKVAQALEITKLNRRVKKLEKRNKVRVLKLKRLQRVRTSLRVDTSDDIVMGDESNQERMIAEINKDDVVVLIDDKEEDKKDEEAKRDETEPAEVQEVVDVVTTAKLITKVVTAASETVTAASAIIPTAEPQVPPATITAAPARVAAAPSRRKKGVIIRILVEEPKPLKKKQQIEMDKEYARNLHAELNKDIDWDVAIDHNVAGFKLDYFKGMSYDDIRLIFEAKFNLNVDFLLKTKEQIKEEESRALQTINETPAEKETKRRKLNEEVKKLCLMNMMMSTLKPLHLQEREDLEALWNLVKERCICLSLEESKDCTWSSKGQELEATRIMWCAYHNIYNHAANFVSEKETKLRLLMSSAAAETRMKK